MYPVSGGTARFPHFAFGGVAGASFGLFAWLKAVTVAPIECSAITIRLYYFGQGIYNTRRPPCSPGRGSWWRSC